MKEKKKARLSTKKKIILGVVALLIIVIVCGILFTSKDSKNYVLNGTSSLDTSNPSYFEDIGGFSNLSLFDGEKTITTSVDTKTKTLVTFIFIKSIRDKYRNIITITISRRCA